MAKIKGLDGLTTDQVNFELQSGARFVVFEYCISLLVVSLKRSSDVFFVRKQDSPVRQGLAYSLCSLVLGWWGIPWGPIWTISTVTTNLRGGRDVTAAVLQAMNAPRPQAQ
jgi:hypothetical protein